MSVFVLAAPAPNDRAPSGRWITPKMDITGHKYGALTVISWEGRKTSAGGNSVNLWRCRCECGKEKVLQIGKLRCGEVTSCGCKSVPRSERRKTHGQTVNRHFTPEYKLWITARRRAKAEGMPFDIELSDIVIPERCPVFPDLRLKVSSGALAPNSPSLDKIVPEKGYVNGNIAVISFKANTIKQRCTSREIRAVADWMERMGC